MSNLKLFDHFLRSKIFQSFLFMSITIKMKLGNKLLPKKKFWSLDYDAEDDDDDDDNDG